MRFPFSKTLQKRRDQKLKTPDKTGAAKVQIDFDTRLKQFYEAGHTDVLIRVHRDTGVSGAPRGYVTQQWTVAEVYDHGNFHALVAEAAGGGDFHAEFLVNRQPVTTEGGKLEKHSFSISGEPKGKRKEGGNKAGNLDLNSLIQNVFKPEVMTALAGFWNTITGQNQKAPDPAVMMNQLTQTLVQLKQLNPEPEVMNPIALIESVMGVMQKMSDQMKPPPTTTGSGGFVESLARGLAPVLSGVLPGGASPQLTPGAGSPGFAGAGTATEQTEQPAADGETINPLKVLRSMVANRLNPDEVAAYAVEAIDTYSKFSTTGDVPPQYRGLLDNPGVAIDFLLSFVPNVDSVYAEQVKAAAIRYVEGWKAQNQPQPTQEEEADATNFDASTATEGEEDAPHPDDGEPGTTEDTEGEDEAGP